MLHRPVHSKRLIDLLELLDRPQPEHADGARLAVHAIGDLFERQPLQVAQDDHVAIVGWEAGKLVGQGHGPLALLHGGTGRGPAIGEHLREIAGRAVQRGADLLHGDLSPHVAHLRPQVRFDHVVQAVDQDLPQPGQQFPFAAAAELGKIAVRRQHRVLHEVRRADPPPQAAIQLRRRQDRQVVSI